MISPRILLRFEGILVLAVALFLYARSENAWRLFIVFILVPDVSIAGYLAGPRVLIWFAHIGADRAVGFGLKYPTAFRDNHLQRV